MCQTKLPTGPASGGRKPPVSRNHWFISGAVSSARNRGLTPPARRNPSFGKPGYRRFPRWRSKLRIHSRYPDPDRAYPSGRWWSGISLGLGETGTSAAQASISWKMLFPNSSDRPDPTHEEPRRSFGKFVNQRSPHSAKWIAQTHQPLRICGYRFRKCTLFAS